MQILALVSDAFGGHGGIARYNQDLLSALSKCSSVSKIITLPRSQHEPAGQLPEKVIQLPAIPNRFHYAAAAVRHAHHMPTEMIVFCGHLYMAPLARIISIKRNAPIWLQAHGVEAWSKPNRNIAWGARGSQLLTAVSRHTRNTILANWWEGAAEMIRVLPNTLDARFHPGPKSQAIIAQHGLNGRKVILTVSRIVKSESYKGHEYVLAAMARLRPKHPNLTYLIAGTGDNINHLREIAKGLGVEKHVSFIGHVPDEQLPDYFRTADVFVMPSLKEGFGIVYLEAAACGLPVIAGNRDGSVDALADGAIGTLVDPQDTAMIAEAIDRALDAAPLEDGDGVARFSRRNFERHVDRLVHEIAQSRF